MRKRGLGLLRDFTEVLQIGLLTENPMLEANIMSLSSM